MCSLNNAINLYREEEIEDNNNGFMVVKKINNVNIPIKNRYGNIEHFNNIEEAEIERIYQQPEYDELLTVFKI